MNPALDLPKKLMPRTLEYLSQYHESFKTLKAKLDATKHFPSIKQNYILDAGDYVMKIARADGMQTTPDTHLYRVQKALKIQAFLKKHRLQTHFVCPQKFIYRSSHFKDTVLSQKIALSSYVAYVDPQIKAQLVTSDCQEGQLKALRAGQLMKKLSDQQIEGLARLSFLGLNDITYNNIFFSKDGKVALLDTEPVKRYIYKKASIVFGWDIFGDKGYLKIANALAGTAKLRIFLNAPHQERLIQKVENTHFLYFVAKKIGCFVLSVFAAGGLIALCSQLALPYLAAGALTLCAKAFIYVYTFKNLNNMILIFKIKSLANNAISGGIMQIADFEKQGIF